VAPADALASKQEMFKQLNDYGIFNFSMLPSFTLAVKAAGVVVAGQPSPALGVLTLALGDPAPANLRAPVTVSPEAMQAKQLTFAKPAWHRIEEDKAARREFVTNLVNLIWAEAINDVSAKTGVPTSQLPARLDMNTHVYKKLEMQCIHLERGVYYAAASVADATDKDRARLVPRVALLHAFEMRAHRAKNAPPSTNHQLLLMFMSSGGASDVAGGSGGGRHAPGMGAPAPGGAPGRALMLPPPNAGGGGGGAAAAHPNTAPNAPGAILAYQARMKIILHVETCTASPCSEFPECATYRELVKGPHYGACRDLHCQVPHCRSSRQVMAHYRECKDPKCSVCENVRAYARLLPGGGGGGGGGKRLPEGMGVSGGGGSGGGGGAPNAKRMRPEGVGASAIPEKPPDFVLAKFGSNLAVMWPLMSDENKAKLIQQSRAQAMAPKQEKKGKLDALCSAIAGLTLSQIVSHVRSLREDFNAGITPKDITFALRPLLDNLLQLEHINMYHLPVDSTLVPGYYDVIKRPMWLSLVKRRLDNGHYRTFRAFAEDVRLVWRNAQIFNPPSNYYNQLAGRYKIVFEKWYEKKVEAWIDLYTKRKENKDFCAVCGGGFPRVAAGTAPVTEVDEVFMYEPPTLFCNTCNSRIKKKNQYWTNSNGKYHWCQTCFKAKPPKEDVLVDGLLIPRAEIVQKNNKMEVPEGGMQCDHCERWVHVVCSMFNPKRYEGDSALPLEQRTPTYCPICLLRHLNKRGQTQAPIAPRAITAAALPKTPLSNKIEARLAELIQAKIPELAVEQDRAQPELPELVVRLVSHTERVLLTGPEMLARYKDAGYPSQHNMRSKVLLLFQNMDGVDVLLYSLYLQEYGDEPGPNRRTAYLSYLDSVRYMEPPSLRTEVYQEILAAYIEDLKYRGYNQLNLWSCPPQKVRPRVRVFRTRPALLLVL
jgi:E1A/CREB-binding protein